MASRYGLIFAANLHLRIIEPCGNRNYTVRSLGVMPAFRLSLRDPAAQCLRVSCASVVSVLFVVFVGSLIYFFFISGSLSYHQSPRWCLTTCLHRIPSRNFGCIGCYIYSTNPLEKKRGLGTLEPGGFQFGIRRILAPLQQAKVFLINCGAHHGLIYNIK